MSGTISPASGLAAPVETASANTVSPAPTPTMVTTAGSGFAFDLVWDSSVSSAPDGFMTDIIAAATFLESEISNAVTIDLAVGYDEIGGNPLSAGDLGESEAAPEPVSYATLVAALASTVSGDATDRNVLASLPATNPVAGATYELTSAQEKALGLLPPGGAAIDGDIGFGPASEFTYGLTNATGTVAAGTYDMFAAAVHEMTEVMGRLLVTGSGGSPPAYSLLDLLHYSSPGLRDFSAGTPGYFSVDGGLTNLGEFNTVARGDAGDWAASAAANAFDAFGLPGTPLPITGNDLTELDAIGWNLTGTSPPGHMLLWTGAGGTGFANAANWNDTTDGLNPAVTAPGTIDLATIANGGTITGTGTAWQLSFTGTNTVAGALAAIDQLTEDSGSLTVTGTLTEAGASVAGTLSVAGGGRMTSSGAIYLLAGAEAGVDGLSSVEVGTAGTGVPGTLTVDPGSGGISGDGIISGPVANNGTILVYRGIAGGNTLVITGAVTGDGTIGLQAGALDGSGAIEFAAVLQLDSSVASSQTIGFGSVAGSGSARTLVLEDPAAFSGTLNFFDNAADTLVLAGQTLTGVSVSGATMTVTRLGGSPLSFHLGNGVPLTGELAVSGQEVIVLPARTLEWASAADASFADPLNWDDTTNGLDPAVTAPGTLDSAEFLSAGGSLAGTGTAAALAFGGTVEWVLGATATLTAAGPEGVTVSGGGAGGLALTAGATIASLGSIDIVSGTSAQAANLTVAGAAATWTSAGALLIGDTGPGSLSVQGGGTLTTAAGLTVVDQAGAGGSSVTVSGAGSAVTVAGALDIGAAGSGGLQINDGATVTAGTLDAGVAAAANALIGLSGSGTDLAVSNAATIGDDGTGVLSVLGGATFTAAGLTIGALGDGSGAVVVSGAGSVLQLAGTLNVGTALGTGDLTVGLGAAVYAQVVNLDGEVVLEGGLLDPEVELIDQGQTIGGAGTLAAGDIVDEGVIQAGGGKPSQDLLVVQGTVLGGGTLTVDGTQAGSSPDGDLRINAGGTLELADAVSGAAVTTFDDELTPAGTYEVNNSAVDATFADGTGVLVLDDIAGFGGTIAAWHAGDAFVITGGTLSDPGVSNGTTLTVLNSGAGGGMDRIVFGSAITPSGFDIVNGDTIDVACFVVGTLIETATGGVPVERLAVGDLVRTYNGALSPVRWIGHRRVDCRRHKGPRNVWPVRVAAGAFGPELPRRDLLLSPDHAVFIDDVLISIGRLINGTSIARIPVDEVTYHHVELPRHDVLFAEGLPAESYLDTGDRAKFISSSHHAVGNPARMWEMAGYAPLIVTGPKLAAAQRRVEAVAARQDGFARSATVAIAAGRAIGEPKCAGSARSPKTRAVELRVSRRIAKSVSITSPNSR